MTDEGFVKIRKKFVEKASKPLIKQLLDDIFEDQIVNDGEKDGILEDNSNRADMARSLFDAVRKKGAKARGQFIGHLQSRDPVLCSELGLTPELAPPAAPAAEPQTEEKWLTTLKPATETFWKGKQNEYKSVYPADKTSMKKRVALLITNIKFADEGSNRNGAEADEENTEKLLRSLGYEVVQHRNLTGKEIDNAVIDFSKHQKLKETDSVLVVIMSHGKLGAVCGVNWKHKISGDEKPDEFPIDNIYKHLGSENCPQLLNKPKIIIIQACRGAKEGAVLVSDAAVVCDDIRQPDPCEDIEDDTLKCVHKEKDFISLLSSTPDTVSYRHKQCGSFLIQYVVDVFNTCAHQDDIEELFRKVMQRFEDLTIHNKRQMPTKDRCTLTKRFYFFPGL